MPAAPLDVNEVSGAGIGQEIEGSGVPEKMGDTARFRRHPGPEGALASRQLVHTVRGAGLISVFGRDNVELKDRRPRNVVRDDPRRTPAVGAQLEDRLAFEQSR